MIVHFLWILCILFLLAGAYFTWIILFFLINPDEVLNSIEEPASEDLTKQRKDSQIGNDTPLMQHVISYIRNGI